ncbi:hypothetical protein E2C01_035575 [Portunus trituberculatus]|uniref:Uncharacterized protein n=1 Tax=Portunus trituberculatus TaxID=210409 RepID=A0A5B7FBV1_PORTR|nr:hypothetical protein [Portunus trituberculatus]
MAPLPSLLPLKLNSFLKPLLTTPPSTPPSPAPSDYFMSSIKILRNDVFHAHAGLNPWEAYGSDRALPIVLKKFFMFISYLVACFRFFDYSFLCRLGWKY